METSNSNNSEEKRISESLSVKIAEFKPYSKINGKRIFNRLILANTKTLKEVIIYDQKNRDDGVPGTGILKLRNLGKSCLVEIKKFLQEKGLSLDMDLAPYDE